MTHLGWNDCLLHLVVHDQLEPSFMQHGCVGLKLNLSSEGHTDATDTRLIGFPRPGDSSLS